MAAEELNNRIAIIEPILHEAGKSWKRHVSNPQDAKEVKRNEEKVKHELENCLQHIRTRDPLWRLSDKQLEILRISRDENQLQGTEELLVAYISFADTLRPADSPSKTESKFWHPYWKLRTDTDEDDKWLTASLDVLCKMIKEPLSNCLLPALMPIVWSYLQLPANSYIWDLQATKMFVKILISANPNSGVSTTLTNFLNNCLEKKANKARAIGLMAEIVPTPQLTIPAESLIE